jgi:hypothetical protein
MFWFEALSSKLGQETKSEILYYFHPVAPLEVKRDSKNFVNVSCLSNRKRYLYCVRTACALRKVICLAFERNKVFNAVSHGKFG